MVWLLLVLTLLGPWSPPGSGLAMAAFARLADVTSTALNPAPIGQIYFASFAWGDYDQDGLTDIAVIGDVFIITPSLLVYRQTTPGSFDLMNNNALFGSSPPGSSSGSIAWADIDGSGTLDLVYTGSVFAAYVQAPNGSFVNGLSLFIDPPSKSDRFVFADYNNDGSMEMFTAGSSPYYRIYSRNQNGSLVDVSRDLYFSFPPSTYESGIAVDDFDGDGYLDIAAAGVYIIFDTMTILRSSAQKFFVDETRLLFFRESPPIIAENAEIIWIDYDLDGFKDLSIAGDKLILALYKFNGTGFVLQPAPFSSFYTISATAGNNSHVTHVWADLDHNGLSDAVYLSKDFALICSQVSPNVFVNGSTIVPGFKVFLYYARISYFEDDSYQFLLASGVDSGLIIRFYLFRSCKIGRSYSNVTSATCSTCLASDMCCPFGQVSSSNLTACLTCPPNSNAAPDQRSCVGCSPGSQPENLTRTCELCPAGTASADGSPCTACAPGTVSAAGAMSCTSCPASSIPSQNRTFCVPCAAGQISAGDICLSCSDDTKAVGNVCVSPGSSANVGAIVGGVVGGSFAVFALLLCLICMVALVLCCLFAAVVVVVFVAVILVALLLAAAGIGAASGGVFLVTRKRYKGGPVLVEEIEDPELRMQRAMELDDVREIPWSEIDVLGKIGSGAFGDVHVAEWRGVTVAVKMLRDLSDNALNDFRHEALMMSKISFHPHVVGFIGISTTPTSVAMVLHYCGGGNLLSALKEKRLAQEQKTRVLWQIASALAFLHSLRIVHRDVAARNILLESDDKAKLSDLGLSRLLESEGQEKGTHSFVGPVRWMAPECIRNGQYSSASDAYAFGVLAWEVWSDGDIPFADCKDLMEVAYQVGRSGRHLTPPPNAPPDQAALMVQLFATDPKSRPSMSEVEGLLRDRSLTMSSRDRMNTMTSDGASASATYSDADMYVAAYSMAD